MMTRLQRFARNAPELFAKYEQLPEFAAGMVVRCPTKNLDGTPATKICGCGSTNVAWAGDVYDCFDCGIFFTDFAADPPHRRTDHDSQ